MHEGGPHFISHSDHWIELSGHWYYGCQSGQWCMTSTVKGFTPRQPINNNEQTLTKMAIMVSPRWQ